MAVVRGSIDKLMAKGLVKQFHKSYALGFRISRQMIEGDLYGGILKKIIKKRKFTVTTVHKIDLGVLEVSFDGSLFVLNMSSFSEAEGKDLIKAMKILLKA